MRHRYFLREVYQIFRFASIHDFQIVTNAGYEICALMDIDKVNRPVDDLLPNLWLKFKRADQLKNVPREPLDSMSAERIEYVRAKIREVINQNYYSVEQIEDPEKLRRIQKARHYDQVAHDRC